MLRLRTYALAVAVAVPSLVACGDDGGNNTPDAPITPPIDAPLFPDTPPDGPSCQAVTLTGDLEFASDLEDATDYVVWEQGVSPSLEGGDTSIRFAFYTGGAATSGAIDLGAGEQANYATCSACVLLFAINATEDDGKIFFQSGGTMTLTEDPFTNVKLAATVTDLSLVEVTIDQQTFESTLVPGGVCLNVGTVTLAADSIPTAWTCDDAAYNDGATCDCECGAHDPDCGIDEAPIVGCEANEVCGAQDTCVAPPANDTCQTAEAITIGTPVQGSSEAGVNNYDEGLEASTCTKYSQSGSDVAYAVELTAGQAIHVKVEATSMSFDPSVALVGPGTADVCDAEPIGCLAGADATLRGGVEEFDFTAEDAGTYYVIVDTFWSGEGGPFTLTVTTP